MEKTPKGLVCEGQVLDSGVSTKVSSREGCLPDCGFLRAGLPGLSPARTEGSPSENGRERLW